ncbi:phosphonate ABC transporter ATP-binding protein [Oceanidesulfovibrio marinus]|uniref:Phosphonate ABC transporter ATP-binding protein n=1 Tax=Oceanidesulfovibrio marinus TaxID=370038 RepID=A0ABX6NC62_9BACT|nr:phosphonate ABC transporter ATP-binding protein [Oceanidesulfovibrio marinus]QJT07941.1 phosphonate ABC transporter ATP-binding protein [Oceanidesulfovibrio marinus]
MLEIQGLSKRFGDVVAVNDVSLSIPKGQFIGIIGSSGAGKSTLLRLINRLLDPSGGSMRFDNTAVCELQGKKLREWRATCAMIFQQFNLVERLDVLGNVLLGRLGYNATLPTLIKQFSRRERDMAVGALERLGMAPHALKRADTLSGGQQQRVAIARALVQEPKLVLADEPIASLDPRNAAMVMDALRTINKDDGITVICNLHQVPTAQEYCDRLVGMAHGRVVFDGAPESLDEQKVQEIYGLEEGSEELECALNGCVPAGNPSRIRSAGQPATAQV